MNVNIQEMTLRFVAEAALVDFHLSGNDRAQVVFVPSIQGDDPMSKYIVSAPEAAMEETLINVASIAISACLAAAVGEKDAVGAVTGVTGSDR